MASGSSILHTPFSGIRRRSDCFGPSEGVDFARLRRAAGCDLQKSRRSPRPLKSLVVKNSSSEMVELEPASDGSPLLGNYFQLDSFFFLRGKLGEDLADGDFSS